jgi:hypothetical protein
MDDVNHEDHEGHEGSDSVLSPRHRMQLPSPLTAEAERVMSETIGCAIRVHRTLGPGFLESIYRKAMYVELGASGLSYESERPVPVRYRDGRVPSGGTAFLRVRVAVLRHGLRRVVL